MIVLNETKIKYELLDELVLDLVKDIRYSSNINVIIDFKQILRKLSRPGILPEGTQSLDTRAEINADIMNIFAHYRSYFYKYGKYTTFYVIGSKSKCELIQQQYPNYKTEYYKKYFDEEKYNFGQKSSDSPVRGFMSTLFKLIEVASQMYIPNMQLIDSSIIDDYAIVKYLKEKIPINQLTFLLTNDPLWFQSLRADNIFALDCKGIQSSLIREYTALDYICKQESVGLSSNMIPFVLSLAGDKKYSISNIHPVGKIRALMITKHLIETGKLQDIKYSYFPIKKEDLNPEDKLEATLFKNYELAKLNYSIISADNLISKNEIKLIELFNQPKGQVTAAKIQSVMSSGIFGKYPLNLDMALKGEKV